MMNNWLKRTICIGTVSLLLAVFLALSFCLPAQASDCLLYTSLFLQYTAYIYTESEYTIHNKNQNYSELNCVFIHQKCMFIHVFH